MLTAFEQSLTVADSLERGTSAKCSRSSEETRDNYEAVRKGHQTSGFKLSIPSFRTFFCSWQVPKRIKRGIGKAEVPVNTNFSFV